MCGSGIAIGIALILDLKGHLLWNAGRIIAGYLEDHVADFIQNRYILEFGAGSGLPSIISALHKADGVVITDYPDEGSISESIIKPMRC